MDHKITLTEAGDKIVQLAFDTENTHRTDSGETPFDTVDLFLQAQIENEFGLSPAQLEAAAKKDAIDQIIEAVKDLTAEEIAPIVDTAKTAAGTKVPNPPIEVKP